MFVSANHSTSGGNLQPIHNGITAWVEVGSHILSTSQYHQVSILFSLCFSIFRLFFCNLSFKLLQTLMIFSSEFAVHSTRWVLFISLIFFLSLFLHYVSSNDY